MSNDNYDAFGDIIAASEGGALGGDGLSSHQSVNWRASPEGVQFQLNCQGCGRTKHMTVEWPEIVALKFGVNPVFAGQLAQQTGRGQIMGSPSSWLYRPDEGAWAPQVRCPDCVDDRLAMSSLRVSPDEPERYLKAGRRQNFINPQGEKLVSTICAQAAQMQRGGR